jgi:hypothetical protein
MNFIIFLLVNEIIEILISSRLTFEQSFLFKYRLTLNIFTRIKFFIRRPNYLIAPLEISAKSWQHCRRHFLARWPSFRLNNPTGPAKNARRKEQMRL